MPRVKRGMIHLKKRRSLKKSAKGYKWGRKKVIKLAKTAVSKAGAYALRDRRAKKRTARALWQIRINAAVRKEGVSYSKFIAGLKAKNIEIDRKILSDLAVNNPAVFKKIAEMVKN